MQNVRFILVEPSHPGNIGATARAMKTMGAHALVLVKPKVFPHPDAVAMASGAEDVLLSAKVVETLDEALEGCQLVLGTSARRRSLSWPVVTPAEAAHKHFSKNTTTAILFGTERTGLSTEQLQKCQFQVEIPTSKHYASLNLSQAVQILAYEFLKHERDTHQQDDAHTSASTQVMEGFFEHLTQTLWQIDFLSPEHPKMLLGRLRRLFNRAEPSNTEINILRGILTQVQKKLTKQGVV